MTRPERCNTYAVIDIKSGSRDSRVWELTRRSGWLWRRRLSTQADVRYLAYRAVARLTHNQPATAPGIMPGYTTVGSYLR